MARQEILGKLVNWTHLITFVLIGLALGCGTYYKVSANHQRLDKVEASNEKDREKTNKESIESGIAIAVMRSEISALRRQNSVILIKQDKHGEKMDKLTLMIISLSNK